jgi:hypothetical protein
LNPTVANAMFGIAGFLPGIGTLATAAGAIEGRGLLSLAQQAGVPGADALSDIGSSVVSGLSSPFSGLGTSIGTAVSDLGTAVGNIDFGMFASSDNDSVEEGDDSVDGDAPPVVAPDPPEEGPPPPPDPDYGADNPLYAANPLDYTVTNLDPYQYTTSPAELTYGSFKDGGMIGFRPLGYANGGEAAAVNRQTVQDFMEQLRSAPVESLNDYMYRRLDPLKRAAEDDPAFAEQLGDVMARTGFDDHMRQLMADSPPAPGLGLGMAPEQTGNLGRLQMMAPQGMAPEQTGNLGRLQMMAPQPPIPQMRPPPPQMPPPQMPMGPNVQGMNRGGIMSLRHM